jgi:mono/diheme cytochrome c family protein
MKRLPLALLVLAAGAGRVAADEAVTFNKDVAPILWKNCAGCHHAGHVGPFPLLTYKDAAKRAAFLRDITASRRMPPWRAEPGYGPFENERRLSDADIRTIARWVEAGAPEGDPNDLPPAPRFPEGWQLGEPDLIVKMPAAFKVPAGGPDVYRCFVIPLNINEDRTVAAIEFRPGNRRVIHHASFFLDDKGQARQKEKEAADGQPGYTSFGGPGFAPVGGLSGWGLAALPRFLPEGTGMLLPKGCDLVMQIHYHPTGKEETDQSELGIYFSKRPAARYFTTFQARTTDIAIPPGEKRHRVTCESAPLPADVTVLTATPHMHFLGKEIAATAVLPGGKSVPLVSIKDWDFHWHERYQFARPLRLPRGTVIHVEAIYDNSADNPKNPNNPPKLVKYGNNLSDEMVSCHLEVITESLADLRAVEGLRTGRPAAEPRR